LDIWRNSTYVVERRAVVQGANAIVRADSLDDALWLVIVRIDGKPARDWRNLQRIKNQLAGASREAVELFPAEARLVDQVNATHLWVLPAGERYPFGFEQRSVDEPAAQVGLRQRPREQ